MSRRRTYIRIQSLLAAVFGLMLSISTAASERGQGYFNLVQYLKKQHNIKRVQDLLPRLPPNLRSNFVLMFESQSLQQASYLDPRVILFSDDADFIMTFNGDKSQEGFETIETARFNYAENRFIFEEILFETDLNNRIEYLKSVGNTTRATEITDRTLRTGPNAQTCLGCHQSDPRPNWEHYSFWPGAYGQFDNRARWPSPTAEFDPSLGKERLYDNGPAAKALPLFVAAAANHPRYRSILNLKSILEVDPNDPYRDTEPEKSRINNNNIFRFTGNLSGLNFRRIVRIMQNSKDYNKLKWSIFYHNSASCRTKQNGFEKLNIEQNYLSFLSIKLGMKPNFLSMNFINGPHVNMITPGDSRQELFYAFTLLEPNFSKYTYTTLLPDSAGYGYRTRMNNVLSCQELDRKYQYGSEK